ncbi:unnamed protein product [Pieris macdunnoughi]|uniref:Mos1 transposase HTH domain-containing protein n=1 Tax=Pieris macdunnoughi TaxID=345717 RepID=A0A821QXW2_9NEOP|nr:unnamed protein product [Pieris macdunnoughi]
MEKNEIRAVIKYFCLKKMSTKDIHSDLVETLGDSAPPYSTVVLCKRAAYEKGLCALGAENVNRRAKEKSSRHFEGESRKVPDGSGKFFVSFRDHG